MGWCPLACCLTRQTRSQRKSLAWKAEKLGCKDAFLCICWKYNPTALCSSRYKSLADVGAETESLAPFKSYAISIYLFIKDLGLSTLPHSAQYLPQIMALLSVGPLKYPSYGTRSYTIQAGGDTFSIFVQLHLFSY